MTKLTKTTTEADPKYSRKLNKEEVLQEALLVLNPRKEMLQTAILSSELMKNLLLYLKDGKRESEVIDSIASVLVRCHQMRLLFHPDSIDRSVRKKIQEIQEQIDRMKTDPRKALYENSNSN